MLSKFNGVLVSRNNHLNFFKEFRNNELMSESYKYISSTIPVLKTLEGKLIRPYLYMIDNKNINNNLMIKSNYD